jgi:hypothetical protein
MTEFDHDLDTATYATTIEPEALANQQRLVANPLLAAVAILGVWALFRYSLEIRNLSLFLATIFAAVVAALLIQFHCLDCGHTGLALRARRHACPAVINRLRAGTEPPALPPTLRFQVKSWIWLAIAAGVLFAIFHHVG